MRLTPEPYTKAAMSKTRLVIKTVALPRSEGQEIIALAERESRSTSSLLRLLVLKGLAALKAERPDLAKTA